MEDFMFLSMQVLDAVAKNDIDMLIELGIVQSAEEWEEICNELFNLSSNEVSNVLQQEEATYY